MRRRGCLMTIGIFAGLILICCAVSYFVLFPQFQDNVADTLSDELTTQVANQLGEPAQLTEGTHTINIEQLQAELQRNLNGQSVEDTELSVDSSGQVKLTITSGEQELGYEGVVSASDGKLVISDMEATNSYIGFFMPADKLGSAIENGVNGYIGEAGLYIESLTPGNNELTFELIKNPNG